MQAVLGAGLLLAGAVLALSLAVPRGLPTADDLPLMMRQPMLVLDKRGSRDCVCFIPTGAQSLPEHLLDALLASEDRRFFVHDGVDWLSLVRALLRNVVAGEVVRGGSTLTQQLAKSFVGDERTIQRKLREAVLAKRIEDAFTKEEILRRYLDRAYFGRGAWGIERAARRYFAKHAVDLTLYESAALVGMLKAPTAYSDDPHGQARRVLQRMVDAGAISGRQAAAARREGPRPGNLRPVEIDARHYVDWIERQLARLPGNAGKETRRVVLGLDAGYQLAAQRAVRAADAWLSADLEAALVAIDRQGRVVALVGGRDYGRSQFDRATMAERQVGSTAKPFTYLLALEQGWQPTSTIADAPVALNGWSPRNHDRRFLGDITLSRALARSRNAATVRLARRLGFDRVAGVLEGFGLPTGPGPSFVLGTAETPLVDLAAAYAGLAAGGRRVRPAGMLLRLDARGSVLDRAGPGLGERIADPAAVEALTGILRRVGARAAPGTGTAGKTGTTQDNRDGLFAGFTDRLTAAAWVGRDDGAPAGVYGGGAPARLWARFAEEARPSP